MSRSWPLRVQDIAAAIDEIVEFADNMTFEQFCADRRTQKAVIANFSIIGEAASHIPEEITNSYLTIPWQSMKDMRNVVVHVYFGVDHAVVWKTIREDLPEVRKPLQILLESVKDQL